MPNDKTGQTSRKNFKHTRCFCNRSGKYLFINISKNASTSIRKSIIFDGYEPYDSLENIGEYLKFMVIRNPLHRIASSYSEIKKLRRDGPWEITQRTPWYQEPNLLKSFEMFLEFITGNFYDSHLKPQKNFLDDKGVSLSCVNEILLFDHLREDYGRLIKEYPQILTHALSLRHEQRSPPKISCILSDFIKSSPHIQKQILSLYSEDFLIYEEAMRNRNNSL